SKLADAGAGWLARAAQRAGPDRVTALLGLVVGPDGFDSCCSYYGRDQSHLRSRGKFAAGGTLAERLVVSSQLVLPPAIQTLRYTTRFSRYAACSQAVILDPCHNARFPREGHPKTLFSAVGAKQFSPARKGLGPQDGATHHCLRCLTRASLLFPPAISTKPVNDLDFFLKGSHIGRVLNHANRSNAGRSRANAFRSIRF